MDFSEKRLKYRMKIIQSGFKIFLPLEETCMENKQMLERVKDDKVEFITQIGN